MKKNWLLPVVVLMVLLIGAMVFWGKQPFLREGPQKNVSELTPAQKEEDFEYLTKLVKEVYPFDKALQQEKGLSSIDELSQDFISRAGKSTSNAEFLQLYYEYMIYLKQAGHAEVVFYEQYKPLLAFFYNIEKRAYRSRDYWMNLASGIDMYVQSAADIRYEDGKYVLQRDYQPTTTLFPAGSVIVKVNGMEVDDYAKSLQTRLHLVWDVALQKVYLQQLLSADPGSEGWAIEAVRPDGTVAKGNFPAYKGYKQPYPAEEHDSNVITRELDSDTGYIKIFSFGGQFKENDHQIIQEFMQGSQGKYSKLIVDLRRNGGGDDDYWADNLVKPLLKEAVDYEQSASVKKSFFERFGLRFRLYKSMVDSTLTNGDRYDVTEVKKEEAQGTDKEEWDTFKVTKHWQPENTFPFDGKLYVLVDSDTFSAADSFTVAVQKLGLGSVAGTNTAGGGCVYMEPYRYALPNSGLLFKLETDLNLNAEGQINEIYGTSPDLLLSSSRYPTPYPISYESEDLMKDEWIRRIMLEP